MYLTRWAACAHSLPGYLPAMSSQLTHLRRIKHLHTYHLINCHHTDRHTHTHTHTAASHSSTLTTSTALSVAGITAASSHHYVLRHVAHHYDMAVCDNGVFVTIIITCILSRPSSVHTSTIGQHARCSRAYNATINRLQLSKKCWRLKGLYTIFCFPENFNLSGQKVSIC